MKKVLSVFSALAAFVAFGIDANTLRDDIPGTATVGEIVAAGGGGGGEFRDFISNGGEVTNGITIVEKDTAAARAEVADVGLTIDEFGVSGTWKWIRYQSGGAFVYSPFSFLWADLISEETDPTVPSWAKSEQNPSYTKGETYNRSEVDGLVAQAGKIKKVANVGPDSNGNVPLSPLHIGAASSGEVDDIRTVVMTWEQFIGGSNVVFSITNYISGAYDINSAKLKINEFRNGEYREVYNSRDEIILHINNFSNSYVRVALDEVVQAVVEKLSSKADRAWGNHTSSGGNAPSNTVYMTAPNTVFAGGMEYQRVAVGEGTICVLTTKGAPVYTQGDEGTFKFQDDGGTNYFGFVKTDSYVVGCKTDGISVQDHVVTLTYDITMSGVPCIWYRESLSGSTPWVQCNTPDGEPIPGAPKVVQWEENPEPGTEVCYINCTEASGLFKATVEVVGETKFTTNMKADLNGGVICSDGITVIYPHANGTWSTTK